MLPCFSCGTVLDTAANDPEFDNVPYKGTMFESRGHYGSTAFDPFDGSYLKVIICDKCLVERKDKVSIGSNHSQRVTLVEFPWEPVYDRYFDAVEAQIQKENE